MGKLKKCKGCGIEISKKAKSCPKCGEPAPKKTSLLTWLVLTLIVIIAIIPKGKNIETTEVVDSNTTPISKEQKDAMAEKFRLEQTQKDKNNPRKQIEVDYEWTSGGFGSVMLVNYKITNKNKHKIKDMEFRCYSSSKSGTRLGSNHKTIYDIVEANSSKKFNKFNMGLMHSQSNSASCEIVSFIYNDKRVWMSR